MPPKGSSEHPTSRKQKTKFWFAVSSYKFSSRPQSIFKRLLQPCQVEVTHVQQDYKVILLHVAQEQSSSRPILYHEKGGTTALLQWKQEISVYFYIPPTNYY